MAQHPTETLLANPVVSADPSARLRLIEAASRLFCRMGINAVGVDAVIAEAGTAKATLYKNFKSKEGLVEAVLQHEGANWRDWFLSGLHEGEATPHEKMLRIFPLLRTWFAGGRFFGCPFINAVAEHDKQDQRLRQLTIAHKKAVLEAIESLAREAGAANPADLSHQIGLLIDGAIIMAMVTEDPAAADLGGGMARMLISKALAN